MKLIKRILFAYYWTKAEKAIKKFKYDEANQYARKMRTMYY